MARHVRPAFPAGRTAGRKQRKFMGLMSTIAVGAAGYWLYRSGRLDPYIRQVKESSLFQQIKDKAGMGTGSSTPMPPRATTEPSAYRHNLSEPTTSSHSSRDQSFGA